MVNLHRQQTKQVYSSPNHSFPPSVDEVVSSLWIIFTLYMYIIAYANSMQICLLSPPPSLFMMHVLLFWQCISSHLSFPSQQPPLLCPFLSHIVQETLPVHSGEALGEITVAAGRKRRELKPSLSINSIDMKRNSPGG